LREASAVNIHRAARLHPNVAGCVDTRDRTLLSFSEAPHDVERHAFRHARSLNFVLVIGAKYVLQFGTMFHDCSWFYGIPS
jgi:hypothetical protein